MFSSLSDSLDKTFRNLRGVGKISESNIADALRDVRLALLEAARLPLPDSYAERKRLMLQCNGRYHTCADEGAVLSFHRRLIDSGLMDSR